MLCAEGAECSFGMEEDLVQNHVTQIHYEILIPRTQDLVIPSLVRTKVCCLLDVFFLESKDPV